MEKKGVKNVLVELDDDALDNVSGGNGIAAAAPASQKNSGVRNTGYAGGIAGYANSGEIKNC